MAQRNTEIAQCNKCGVTYTDKESVELAKKWIATGYAPCPSLFCKGQLEVGKAFTLKKGEG